MGTGRGIVTAKFDLSGMKANQQAGFVRFSSIYHMLGVHMNSSGIRRLIFNANGKVTRGPVIKTDKLWIRTVNDGDQAHFAYSTDGGLFIRFGPEFTIKFGNWCGDRLGFYCWNDKVNDGYIDIDWYHYNYDGPKGQSAEN